MSIKNLGKAAVAALSISAAGLGLIVNFEGTRDTAYLDSVGVPTICTGSTRAVRIGQEALPGECDARLREDTSVAGKALERLVRVPVTQGQYDALLSFTFNLGEGNLSRSTLLRKLNAGDCHGAAREFLRWDRAGGQVLRGLTLRRQAEARLFEGGCDAE